MADVEARAIEWAVDGERGGGGRGGGGGGMFKCELGGEMELSWDRGSRIIKKKKKTLYNFFSATQ